MLKRKRLFLKTTMMLLVFAMLWGQSAFAETVNQTVGDTGANAPRMKFPDVSANHWGLKHVTKLALQNIIQGDDKGNFNPDVTVSQQDAIIMAIRMMGLEEQVLSNKTSSVLPFDVTDYAKPYVAAALDKNLITIQEETSVVSASKSWGTRGATREWIAKIVIRAINKQDEAAKLAQTATIFKDNKDISSWALGFINTAVALRIVDGMPDGSFKPTDAVTRAQMAAFLSRADKYLVERSNRVAIGFVSEFTDKKLTIRDEQGRTADFNLSNDIVFYSIKDDSARIPSSNIRPNLKVYVLQDKGTAYYVEDLDETMIVSLTLTGTLGDLNVDQMTLTLSGENGIETHRISPTISVIDRDGKGSSLGSLMKGSQLELKKTGDIVDKITVKAIPVNKTGEAKLIDIDLSKMSFIWLDKSTNATEIFTYSSQVSLKYNNNEIELDKLNPGDDVQYQVTGSVVTSIVVTKPVIEPAGTVDQGRLESIDVNKKIMTINTSGNKLAAYHISDIVQVVIEGVAAASLSDLVVGDDVKIQLSSDRAIKITVLNRSVKAKLLSTIINYHNESRALTVQDSSGNFNVYKLTTSTGIIYPGFNVTLDTFGSTFTSGKKVDITASAENLVSIRMSSEYDGTVVSSSNTSNELTIRTNDNNLITFKLTAYVPISIPGQFNTTLESLKAGDNVRVSMTYNQDAIAYVNVRKDNTYRILSVDLDTRNLTVREPLGSTISYYIGTNVPIESISRGGLLIQELVPDQQISMSFFGSTIEKITTLNATRGKVTAVDVFGGKYEQQEQQWNKG